MPKFGPIKRRELIHYLRELGFEGPYVGGNTSTWSKEKSGWRFPTPIRVISAGTCSPGFCGRPELTEASGNSFERWRTPSGDKVTRLSEKRDVQDALVNYLIGIGWEYLPPNEIRDFGSLKGDAMFKLIVS